MTRHTPELKPGARTASRRVLIIVIDGAGAGATPDAAAYGDAGANTLVHVLQKHGTLKIPNLLRLGLAQILRAAGEPFPQSGATPGPAYFGRLAPRSPGKDTTSGHWELAGLILQQPFPLYPEGFPAAIIAAFEKAIGRKVLGNLAASGTEIIERLGAEHLASGAPIVYTSADSVFQIAAHEEIVPPEELYRWCLAARRILQGEHAVGRVIARPFIGKPGSFKRTARRRDFSLAPPGETLLDRVAAAGETTAVVGKVADIFAHRGIAVHLPGGHNKAVGRDLIELQRTVQSGLIWATFGDTDSLYGHRNDSAGFAAALEHVDSCLGELMAAASPDDLLLITADHGCDPTHPGTDHTREYVPLMAWCPRFTAPVDLGTRSPLSDLGATAAQWLGIKGFEHGSAFL